MNQTHAAEPIAQFVAWHREATRSRLVSHPNAMCVSTVDSNGAPRARYVDLKEVRSDGFVFCTSYASPKAHHLESCALLSLTFWWDHAGRQVRVAGLAEKITAEEADRYFAERPREAQIASWAYRQSAPLERSEHPSTLLAAAQERFGSGPVPRPPYWGGYLVRPHSVEFLLFREDRSHERLLYQREDGRWRINHLQP